MLKEPKATKNNLSKPGKSTSRANKSVDYELLSQEDLFGSDKGSISDKKSSASADRQPTPILRSKRLVLVPKSKGESC